MEGDSDRQVEGDRVSRERAGGCPERKREGNPKKEGRRAIQRRKETDWLTTVNPQEFPAASVSGHWTASIDTPLSTSERHQRHDRPHGHQGLVLSLNPGKAPCWPACQQAQSTRRRVCWRGQIGRASGRERV